MHYFILKYTLIYFPAFIFSFMSATSQLLSGFFESIGVGVRITNAEGTIVLVNSAYCTLYGYTKEEMLGKNFTFVLPAEQREDALKLYMGKIQESCHKTPPEHWEVQRKNGKKITVAVRSFNIRTAENTCYRVAQVREVSQMLTSMNQKEFYVSVLQNVEDSVLVSDLKGFIIYLNKGTTSLYQIKEEEALGHSVNRLWPEQNFNDLLDFFREGNKQFVMESWPYQAKDGTSLYINLKITPLLDPVGSLTGLIFMSQDVTEKHSNEQEVLQQRNMLASLIESQSNYLIRLDTDGRLSYTNNAFISSTIYQENMEGKAFSGYIYPDDRKIWEELFSALQDARCLQKAELRMTQRNGTPFWTKWEFVCLSDPKGRPSAYQGVGSDISNRKKIEQERDKLLYHTQALNEELQANEEELSQNLEKTIELNHFIQKSKKRFQSLLENSFEAIILYDAAGYITYASSSVEKTLGYSYEEMLGQKGMAFIHPDDKAHTRELLARMMEQPENRVYILQRVKRKAGNYIWTESYNTNLLQDENVRGIVSNFRDVTERIEAEERLRDSEASLNLAQHIANLGSAEFDLLNGKVKHSSGVFAIYDFDLTKFSEEEFNGFDYTHPEDVDKAKGLFNNFTESGPGWIKALADVPEERLKEVESAPFEYRIISAQGRLKYLRTKSRFIRNKEGKPIKSILTIQDITEEKHRERLLDETSRIAGIGGWELDLQSNQISWTLQTYQMFGIPAGEELTVEKASSFYLPEYQPAIQEAYQKLLTDGTPFDLEVKMALPSQKAIWVRLLGQAEKINGKVVLAKGTMQDITGRKEAEREIREYADRLRMATEAAGIGIWDWDLKLNTIVWDHQMKKLYNVPEEKEVVEYNVFQKAVHPEDLPKVEASLEAAMKSKNTEFEFRIITPSSDIKWIKSYARVFDDEAGIPKRMVGVNWDISWLKQTEETLRHNNEELLKTNQELDHFVYSTSHNLRAPLTSIMGIIHLINGSPETADYGMYMQLIEKSVIKLDETIQEIADYSRNTRVEVVLEEVDFEPLIQEVIESLSFLEQAKKINISYVVPENLHFFSDNSRLKMIFTNLVSNAIKYYDPEEEDPYIIILIEQDEKGIFVHIKDNGIGIAPQHQGRIFNMFFRASSKSTGSGLGLYIVREAIYKLGGTIEVNSSPGKGTEFILFLPNQQQIIP